MFFCFVFWRNSSDVFHNDVTPMRVPPVTAITSQQQQQQKQQQQQQQQPKQQPTNAAASPFQAQIAPTSSVATSTSTPTPTALAASPFQPQQLNVANAVGSQKPMQQPQPQQPPMNAVKTPFVVAATAAVNQPNNNNVNNNNNMNMSPARMQPQMEPPKPSYDTIPEQAFRKSFELRK